MLKALIFDVDGTMAETEEAHRAAFNELFAEMGLNWHWDFELYRTLLGTTGGQERMRQYIKEYAPPGGDAIDPVDEIVEMHKRKTFLYTQMVSGGQLALRPGVERLIDEARKGGIKLAICTTTNLIPLKALFEGTLGLAALEWFEAIATGDMVGAKKPAPDLYQLALRQLGLPANECLAIEDSRNGLMSAQSVQIETLITISQYTSEQSFPEAMAVVSDLGEPGAPASLLEQSRSEELIVDLATLQRWHSKATSLRRN